MFTWRPPEVVFTSNDKFMGTLEEQIQRILLTVAVEKPKPDWCGVYTGLYVFPAMTEGFIRTCIVADIAKTARRYFSTEAEHNP